ncbi:hypothetical protein BG006_002337 [Podila minutissima]|uniref:C2H2-type domain-containing protein n=1 Tax=Podila minutissima TaxID=64525 RepID=A0A9P5VGK2_9FUNG|nr:hypothetical protein BG006_002337 [Podila minutissima]
MSFSATCFTPTPIGREGFHQRSCSGSAYSEEMFMKIAAEPRDLYQDRDLSPDSDAYLHVDRAGKPPRDRMRLQGILNGSSEEAMSPHMHQENINPDYRHYPSYQDSPESFQSMPVGSLSMSPYTTMPMSGPLTSPPMTSFPTMGQPNFDESMSYSYNYHQGYSFKHAGNAKAMDVASVESSQEHHHYQYSPEYSSSPPVLASLPQRTMNSLVDHPYTVSESPPASFYHGQSYFHPHSPISNGSYTNGYGAPGTPGSATFTPTPPATPHYGITHGHDGRYGPIPGYGDQFTLQSQPVPRSNRYAGSPSSPTTSNAPRPRKTYAPRAPKTSDSNGSSPAPRRFQCNECEKAFPTKGELASHARCHLKVPAFLCGICGRPFKRRTDYVRHVRNVHEEVGRYSCAQCGERFGRLDKLKRHDKRGCGNDKDDDE